jgi:formamidopyrimidine-DNA glycosylase
MRDHPGDAVLQTATTATQLKSDVRPINPIFCSQTLDHELNAAEVFQRSTSGDVVTALCGRVVDAVLRKGKYFWLQLSGQGPDLLMHFGMAGYLSVKGKGSAKYVRTHDDGSWPPRFCKLEVTFEDGTILAFSDGRRYAASES